MKPDTFDVYSIIALRKIEFFSKIWKKLDKIVASISANEKNNLRAAIIKIISNMDVLLFLSKEEKKKKIINKNVPLDELKLDQTEILRDFKNKLKKTYPRLKFK